MLEMALMAGGMAMQLIGSANASTASNNYYKTQSKIAGLEGEVNDQRKAAMEVDARRRQLEIVRNNQRARSMAQTTATNQGAQMGSGLQGAYSGISGQSETNLLGVNQNLEIGRNIFGLDTQISQQRIMASNFQGQQASDQAMAQMGGSIMGSAGKISQLASGAPGAASDASNYMQSLFAGPFAKYS